MRALWKMAQNQKFDKIRFIFGGETRYKKDFNAFLLAKTLLEKYNCTKILDVDLLVQAIAFEIGLYQMLIENNILIKEFGIDATCKLYFLLSYIIYK